MFKKLTTLFFLAGTFILASCAGKEIPFDPASVPPAKVGASESLLTLRFEEPGMNPDTKSVISAADFDNTINSVLVYLVSSDGSWEKAYSASGSSGLADKKFTILADGSTYYDIYALVNMGEADFTPASPQNWVYTLPESFSSLSSTGLPMCRSARINASEIVAGRTTSKTLTLRRLLSKVVVKVVKNKDATGMLYGAPDGSALQGGSLKVKQVPKVIRPFAPKADRRAQSTSELYTGDSDYHNFTASDGQSLQSSEVVLYVPENRQGANGSATGTQAAKTPASGRGELSTYLEYTATKNGSSDGVSGHLTYKAYLGENETSDFNVIGDKVYTATLSLSWDGMWEGSWRVSQGDWADTRALVISAAAGSATAMASTNTKAGSQKVRKASPTAFYMNFFPGGTSGSVAHGRKDMDSWPYGWVAYVDGSSVNMSGTSGSIKNASNQSFISWNYDGDTDCLSMQAIAGAPANSDIHTLQFKTLDGRKSSNVVYFTASIPFEYQWEADAVPNHVAQRGILKAIDPDTGNPSSEAIIKLKDANSSQVRMTDNGDGTAVVELIDGFSSIENAIRIADSDDDRECLVPLEGRVPWFETGTITPTVTFVDDRSSIRFTYLAAAANGSKTTTPLKVVDNRNDATAVAAGENLDLGLVNELIAPVMGGGSSSSRLGYEYSPDSDGNLNIRVHIHTYEGVNALIGSNTNRTFTVGKTRLAMPSVTGGHSQAADMQDFKAYNPWRLITGVAQGGVMEDYTLYNEPARDGTKMAVGWSATPLNKPSQPVPNEWTTDIANVIVNDGGHIAYDASFQDGAGYLGSDVCSHVGAGPAAVDPDFSPSASTYYTVRLRVSDLSNYDWKTIGDYLWYDQGHYLTGVWVSPTATEAQRKQAVDDAFADGPVILTGWYNTADAAWAHVTLPSGVTRSTPSAIDGAVFETYTRTETISSTWTLRYTMKDMTESQVKTHNAGKIDVVLRIINPFNDESPSLDKKVAEAYVKLHLYVWPAPYEVVPVSPAWNSITGHGWGYSAFPYCYTGGKTAPGLDGSGFFNKPILIPATETYTTTSTAFLKGTAASVGAITRDRENDPNRGVRDINGSATYQFYNNDAFSDSDSDARRMSKLLGYMSDNQTTTPFKLRAPTDTKRNEIRYSEQWGETWQPYYENDVTYDGLNKVLGSATFYRADDHTLYYDPTGSERKYTYAEAGSSPNTTDKLFVIHIGGNTMGIRNGHYFHPYWF